MVLIVPLILVLFVLPLFAFYAVCDCLGLIEPEPKNNAIRDEWDKWQAQNRQRGFDFARRSRKNH